MKNNYYKILKSKKIVINNYLIKIASLKELSLNEFLVLAYFDNNPSDKFDVNLISNDLNLDTNSTLEAFNNLMLKGLINLESSKDEDNRLNEKVSLDNLYKIIISTLEEEEKKDEQEDIFKIFEKELGRTISSMELELINGWLSSGTKEELILGALKEAVYNGVTNFRYIDKIIYEWERKGFKNMDDVNKYMQSRREKSHKDTKTVEKESKVLEYNWLDDDEN